jgi:nicotinamidase-related amidase
MRHKPRGKGKTMPLTKLDTNASLVVIDLQKGIVNLPTVHPGAEIVARAARLVRAFRERGLPVVLVNVTAAGPGGPEARAPNI